MRLQGKRNIHLFYNPGIQGIIGVYWSRYTTVTDFSRSATGIILQIRFIYRQAGRLSNLAASISGTMTHTIWSEKVKRTNAGCAVGKKRKPSQDEVGLFNLNSFRMVLYGNPSFAFHIFYGIYRVNNVRAPVILMVGKEKPLTMIQLVTAYHLNHC